MRKHLMTILLSLLLAVLTAGTALPTAGVAVSADDGAAALVAVASGEINYYEETDGSTKYGRAYGSPKLERWDGAFVAWCAREAGIAVEVIPNYTDINAIQSFFKGVERYHTAYSHGSDYVPRAGDIAFFSLTSDRGALTSVGVVKEVASGKIAVIEGDCPNRVRENSYDFLNKTVIGFASPAYQEEGATARAAAASGGTKTYAVGIYTLNYDMNLRESASLNAAILTVIPKDTVVLVDTVSGVWGHTTYGGKEGWMSLEFSTMIGNAESKYLIGKYRTDYDLNFRSTAAELSNNIIGLVPVGTVVTVTELSDFWGKTTYQGKTGWISLKYCTYYTPGNNEPAGSSTSTDSASVDWLVIDISRHNAVANFNWPAMKAAGLQGVIMRVGGRGYGDTKELYDDTAFYQHYLGAKAAGLHVGAYFFSYALTQAQAKEEAQMTINILRSCNAQLDMPVYIDIEDYVEEDGQDDQHLKAGKAVCTMVVDTFCKAIKEAGYYPGVYCNKNFAESLLDKSVFEGRALWIAQYADKCTYTQSKVGMWQYTSEGRINGYSGQFLDMNRCYVNYPGIIAGTVSEGHTNPNPTPGRADETTTSANTADRTPTAQRSWEVTKAPTCTEDGVESIFEGTQVYMKRSVRAQHGESVNCVLRDSAVTLNAGEIFDLKNSADRYYDKNSEYYDAKCGEVKANGGCLFRCCPTCGEILQVEFYYKTGCKHDYQEQTVSAATCTKEGVTKTVCSKCGKTGAETVVPRSEHASGEMQYYEGANGSPSYYGILCGICKNLMYASYNMIAGDVDGNFKVEAADARLTLRHAIGLEQISFEYQKNADYDKNGAIEPADARLILRKSVNLEP